MIYDRTYLKLEVKSVIETLGIEEVTSEHYKEYTDQLVGEYLEEQ